MNLLILKVNQLGDNVIFLPIVQTLRKLVPDWKITVFTSPVAAALYAADLPAEQIVAIPTAEFNKAWKRPWKMLPYLQKARRVHADATFVANDQGNVAFLLALLLGGKVRVGEMRSYIKVKGALTHEMTIPPNTPAGKVNWLLAAKLCEAYGIKNWPEEVPPPNLEHLSGPIRRVEGRVIIHAGASLAYKRWFPERFVALANRLSADHEVIWVTQDWPEEKELKTEVQRVKPTSLESFLQLLATANLLVGNNSGPMNLAVALGCPVVVINGPSHQVWDPIWYPERNLILRETSLPCLPCDSENHSVEHCLNQENPMACMKAWPVETVEARCREWLARWPVEKLAPATQLDGDPAVPSCL
ncbi:MAG: glycosyltransferase family 9 protein [Chthoniobacteraceae bacterium]